MKHKQTKGKNKMNKQTKGKNKMNKVNEQYKQNALADIEGLDMLKDELYESKMMTNDDTRDIAIRCVDRLVLGGYVKDCVDTNDTTEFSVQDIIHEEINKTLRGV